MSTDENARERATQGRDGGGDGLDPRDAGALDSLVETGFDAGKATGADRARVEKLSSLLGLLRGVSVSGDRAALIDVTMARIAQAAPERSFASGADEPVLSGEDAEALEAWVLAGYDAEHVPGPLRARARRLESMAALARAASEADAESRESLIERTLAAAEANTAPIPISMGRRLTTPARWRDLVSVAALVLIGVSVVWPVLSTVRAGARRTECAGNLGLVASAMGVYAGDNRDALPMASAGFGGGSTWWSVGTPSSNSANLYTLVRERYAGLAALACPGNPRAPTVELRPGAIDWGSLDEISYSYQIMRGEQRPAWSKGGRVVIVADRSPVVLRAVRREWIRPMENSPNHGGHGQDVMFSDGSVEWRRTPVTDDDDNIWLPAQIEEIIRQVAATGTYEPLKGTETPRSAEDSFVGP